jgi:anion-transporting  ArsA/GET3 family ATPase
VGRFSRIFTTTHFVDYITTAAPGLKDILVLGKIWYLEQNRPGNDYGFDTIIVDAPAAGHMLTFMSAPMGLSDAVQVGPIRRQSDWLIDMLRDPGRTRAHLVTIAEEIPVQETLETSAALEDRLEISQGPVFVNALYPHSIGEDDVMESSANASGFQAAARRVGLTLDREDIDELAAYARFLLARRSIQTRHLRAVRRGTTQPVISLPYLFSAGLGLPEVETIADVIEDQAAQL